MLLLTIKLIFFPWAPSPLFRLCYFNTATVYQRGVFCFRYGCCSDEHTAALGPYQFGCPPNEFSLLTYPQNLAIAILGGDTDSLKAKLTWDPPSPEAIVDLYTVRLSM